MRVCGQGGVGFHTLFLLALVSVFSHLAVLFMCVCVCAWSVPLAPSLALLTYLLAIPLFPRGWWASLVRLFIVSPLSVAAPYLLRFCWFFFSSSCISRWLGAYGGINMGDIWLSFVFAGMPFDVRGGSSFFFACGVVPWAPSFATYLVFSSTHV